MKRKPRRKPAYSTYTAPLDVALIAQRTDPTNLRYGFGVFLIYASIRMLAPQLFTRTLRRIGGRRA